MIRFLVTDSHNAVGRRSPMRFLPLVLLVAALASLAACGSTAASIPTAPAATNTPTFANVAPGTVLFQSEIGRASVRE